MNQHIFKTEELIKPKFFQQLFGIEERNNIDIEINNLLATKEILKVSKSEIENILRKYEKPPLKEGIQRLYQRTVHSFCMDDWEITENELKQLNHLQSLLNMSDSEAEEILNNTRRMIVMHQLNKITEDKRITADEWNNYSEILKKMKVSLNYDDEMTKLINKYKLYYKLETEDLVSVSVNVNLQKNEQCYCTAKNVNWYEIRKTRVRVNYSGPTYRIKIAKGFYYRIGSLNVAPNYKEEYVLIDTGTLYITNKRIIFTGSRNNKTISLSSILSLTPYTDGVEIEKSGKSPILTGMEDVEIILIVLSKLLTK